jgi:hypothetical protein
MIVVTPGAIARTSLTVAGRSNLQAFKLSNLRSIFNRLSTKVQQTPQPVLEMAQIANVISHHPDIAIARL